MIYLCYTKYLTFSVVTQEYAKIESVCHISWSCFPWSQLIFLKSKTVLELQGLVNTYMETLYIVWYYVRLLDWLILGFILSYFIKWCIRYIISMLHCPNLRCLMQWQTSHILSTSASYRYRHTKAKPSTSEDHHHVILLSWCPSIAILWYLIVEE